MESVSSVTLFIPTKGRGEGESGVERGGGSCVVLVCVTTNEKNAEAGDVTAAAASQCTALVTPPTNPLCMCARACASL